MGGAICRRTPIVDECVAVVIIVVFDPARHLPRPPAVRVVIRHEAGIARGVTLLMEGQGNGSEDGISMVFILSY